MSGRFDRNAPGDGAEVNCRLENGKAVLEWSFFLEEEDQEGILRLTVTDAEGKTMLECIRRQSEEEPAQTILLQPHLWNGVRDPYLYTLEAMLLDKMGTCRDRLRRPLALYDLEYRSGKGMFLNGNSFEERAVRYYLPEMTAEGQHRTLKDLRLLRELGANTIYAEQQEGPIKPFLQLCQRVGFLAGAGRDKVPVFRGEDECLFSEDTGPTALFYRYKARWCREPFVYIVPESVKPGEDGNYTAVVYSNCSRVALYSDGILHEFQSGSEEFVFRGIPGKHPYLILTAEAEDCTESLSIHKAFTNLM